MKIAFIDPSINDTGYAVFNNKILEAYGVIKPDEKYCAGLEWTEKALSVALKIHSLFCSFDVDKYIIEMPTTWYTPRGQVAKDSGGIQKLYYMCGLIVGHFPEKCELITPQQWKGQTPKYVTYKQISKIYPKLTLLTTHECDAIGLGLWYLKQESPL